MLRPIMSTTGEALLTSPLIKVQGLVSAGARSSVVGLHLRATARLSVASSGAVRGSRITVEAPDVSVEAGGVIDGSGAESVVLASHSHDPLALPTAYIRATRTAFLNGSISSAFVRVDAPNIVVGSFGHIHANALGYSAGHGAGAAPAKSCAGAGHGDIGGAVRVKVSNTLVEQLGGTPYNEVPLHNSPQAAQQWLVSAGSGGTVEGGARGGGIVFLNATSHARVDGLVSADGDSILNHLERRAGAAAGGSIVVQSANTLSGEGEVRARP